MKKAKVIILWLVLLFVSVAAFACAGGGNLKIDAPEKVEAELGTYAIPKYDVIDGNGIVRAGYEVKLVSIKDSSGSAVDFSGNSVVITTAGVYDFEYTAGNKKIPNVTVKVDFADRTPPTVNVNTDSYPDLFIKGHEYNLPQYSYGAGPDLSKCWMKMYYKPVSGEKVEKKIEGLFFQVTEGDGEYEFVFHGEDAVGNVKEVVHTVPVDGPETLTDGRIAYFNEPFGARQLKFVTAEGSNSVSASFDESVKYEGEAGSTLITMAEETNYAIISVAYPVVEDLSNYDTISWRVYNPNDYKVIFGLTWTAYKTLEPYAWAEFSLPTSYFRNHGDDALQNVNGTPVYEDNIARMSFVVLYEFWAQNGNVQAGTKINISAFDAHRNGGNDLRIGGEAFNCVYDETEYELGEYNVLNRAGVPVDGGTTVTLKSAKKPDGVTDATIEDGVLKFDGGEGIYTLVYSATYSGDKYGDAIDDLTVKIMNGGELESVEKGESIGGVAVYADRKWGIKQIHSLDNVAAQIDTETKFGEEAASMKFTVIKDGLADVVFNTETMANPDDYAAIEFKVHTKNNKQFRVYATYGENAQYLGGDQVTCFDTGDDWTTVTVYLGNKDRSKIGVHFFNDYSGTPVPAGTEIFVSNIKFMEAGYQNMPTDSTVDLLSMSENKLSVPATVKGRDNVDYAVTNVSVTKDGNPVEIEGGKFTLATAGEYVVKYTLHDKEYSYTVTATADLVNIELLYDPQKTTYAVSPLISVTDVKLNGSSVERDGNTFNLTDDGDYVVTAQVFGESKSFTVYYYKPTSPDNQTAMYVDIGDKQVIAKGNLTVEKATDSVKGNVLKLTVSADQTGNNGTGVKFKNLSNVSDYDYISFDIKSSVAGIALSLAHDDYYTQPYSSHYVRMTTDWQKISFNLKEYTNWYTPKDYSLSFFREEGTLAAGTVFEITNIILENGNAQIDNVTYNMANGEYVFPATVADKHNVAWNNGFTNINCKVEVRKVSKDGTDLQISATGVTFPSVGEYTVTYVTKSSLNSYFAREYTYTVTVINQLFDDETLYYGASEEYTLPTQTNKGEAVSVTGVTCGDSAIDTTGGKFSLVAGTPTTANDTNTYVYTVNYTADGGAGSYTVTYRKPSLISTDPVFAAYMHTQYGIDNQLVVENGIAVHDTKQHTDTWRGSGSTK